MESTDRHRDGQMDEDISRSSVSREYVNVHTPESPGYYLSKHGGAVNRSLKSRLFSMWNNAVNTQFFKPKFSLDSPLWVLGELYGARTMIEQYPNADGRTCQPDDDHIENALLDITSRIWLTYREGFPSILGSKYTSDVGWGCMIRSAQMLLAQAIVMCTVGRGFRLDEGGTEKYREILSLFHDTASSESPFSVHNLISTGSQYGMKPGTWLGPSIACTALCRAVNQFQQNSILGDIAAYVALDCLISKAEIMRVITATGQEFRPILILIPLRLGVEKLNQVYVPSLQNIFSYQECVGLIGGKPGHSCYYIGFQDNELIGLDPHLSQLISVFPPDRIAQQTYQCRSPRKVKFASVDPSLAIGFICRSPNELERFYRLSQQDSDGRMTPLYTVEE